MIAQKVNINYCKLFSAIPRQAVRLHWVSKERKEQNMPRVVISESIEPNNVTIATWYIVNAEQYLYEVVH